MNDHSKFAIQVEHSERFRSCASVYVNIQNAYNYRSLQEDTECSLQIIQQERHNHPAIWETIRVI